MTRGGQPALVVEALAKTYEVYAQPIDRLKQALFMGQRRYYSEFSALDPLSFSVQPGEALAVLGRNGAGESTLLHLIAGTLRPTSGEVRCAGRVGALLALGVGFDPELSGRRNVFVSAAILGIPRAEVAERFDEIEAFAEIGAFIDQPVRTYSSGMLVRLAFAVNVLLEPDLLLVDEALAVGDAAFQMKCISAMRRLKQRGTAIVLVTHSVDTARSFCDRALWLHEGALRASGDAADVSARYMRFMLDTAEASERSDEARLRERGVETDEADRESGAGEGLAGGDARVELLGDRLDLVRWGSGEVVVEAFAFGERGRPHVAGESLHLDYSDRVEVAVRLRATCDIDDPQLGFGFCLRNAKGLDVITYTSYEAGVRLPALAAGSSVELRCVFDQILSPGNYALVLACERAEGEARHYYDFIENAAIFETSADRLIFSAVLPEIETLSVAIQPAASPAGES